MDRRTTALPAVTATVPRAMPLTMAAAQKLDPTQEPTLARLLAAPLDDVPETDEEREAVARIEANIRAGRHGSSTAEVLAALDQDD